MDENKKWFTDNLPRVGDIVQHVAHYTGYVREINRQDGYVKIKWFKGVDNIFEDYAFFKYNPWNGTTGTIQVVTQKVSREWWPEGNDWLFINLDIWRDYHHLTEMDMIEAVHESGGPLAFAIEKGIYQTSRWTPPVVEDEVYEDFKNYSGDSVPTVGMLHVGDTVAVDSYGHQLNGKIVNNDDFPETVDVEFEHVIWGVNFQDLYSFSSTGQHISQDKTTPFGNRLLVQTTRNKRTLGVVVDREDEDNYIVYFNRVTISVAIDLLITE